MCYNVSRHFALLLSQLLWQRRVVQLRELLYRRLKNNCIHSEQRIFTKFNMVDATRLLLVSQFQTFWVKPSKVLIDRDGVYTRESCGYSWRETRQFGAIFVGKWNVHSPWICLRKSCRLQAVTRAKKWRGIKLTFSQDQCIEL